MNETKVAVTPHHEQPRRPPAGRAPVRRHLPIVAIVIVVVALLLVVWYTIDVLVLVFTGILLAVFLRGLSDILSRHTPLGGQSSLLVVVIMLLGIVGVGIWLLAPQLSTQIGQLTETLPRAIQSLEQRLLQHGIGRWLLAQTPSLSQVVSEGNWLSRIARVFSTTFGVLASLVVILAVGLYMAISPRSYTEGVVRLVPIANRRRAREVVQAVGQTLRWWLLGRWVSMAVVGLLTAVGLWVLGVPLALTFGLLAAVLTFVPYLGPILSAIPPSLWS